jgi:hypothetical protein
MAFRRSVPWGSSRLHLEPLGPGTLLPAELGLEQDKATSSSEASMSRRAWSNLFILLAAVNLALGALPGTPAKLLAWIAFAGCLALGGIARRRMV